MKDYLKRPAWIVCAAAAVLVLANVPGGSGHAQDAAVAEAISAERILDHIKYLSGDELQGRGTGEEGGFEAAKYIAAQFAEAGLAPAGGDGSFLQEFEAVVGSKLGEDNELSVSVGGTANYYDLETDFRPLSFSESAAAEGGAVFAGYGITAPRYGYDDYEGVDAQGKIVFVMRHEPAEADTNSPFEGTSLTHYSDLNYKAMNAREHGAAALVLFTDPLNHDDADEELLDFDSRAGKATAGIPCVQMTLAGAREFLALAGLDLEEAQAKIDSELKPQSAGLEGVHVAVTASVVRDVRTTYNVVGRLEGAGPALKDHTIYVGAHYDHLGTKDGEVYPGADDNASGTAALIELAHLAASVDPPPARSMVFAAFGAEEIGLLGSSHIADKLDESTPPDAMINMDMVGRLRDNELMVGGVGTSPLFRPMLEEMAEGSGFTLDYSEAGYGPSDHSPFYSKGVPVVFFFTGIHDDHHKPTDTWDKINSEGEARVASFVYDFVSSLASMEEIPFTRARGETAEPPGGEGYGGFGRARLGIVPDFSGADDIVGVRIEGAREGSPAEAAGLQAGDIMVSFDGRGVTSLRDLMYFLKDKKPGDEVIIIVKRDGVEVTLEAVLGTRTGKSHR
jgi:hypothetical protein